MLKPEVLISSLLTEACSMYHGSRVSKGVLPFPRPSSVILVGVGSRPDRTFHTPTVDKDGVEVIKSPPSSLSPHSHNTFHAEL